MTVDQQAKLKFLLSWPIAIGFAVAGSKLGGPIGLAIILPIAVATGVLANLLLSRSWPFWQRIGSLLALYSAGGVLTSLARNQLHLSH